MFPLGAGKLWAQRDGIQGGRMLAWIYMMVPRAIESGGGSLLELRRLVGLMVVEEGGCYEGSLDHVYIFFEYCGCMILNWRVNRMVNTTLMTD